MHRYPNESEVIKLVRLALERYETGQTQYCEFISFTFNRLYDATHSEDFKNSERLFISRLNRPND